MSHYCMPQGSVDRAVTGLSFDLRVNFWTVLECQVPVCLRDL